ncbi:MAG: DUF2971 domain-containing protein [Planctomycetota bacterium]|nr:DUF2971 domain-containing protein [Planctomycetota bacterium]
MSRACSSAAERGARYASRNRRRSLWSCSRAMLSEVERGNPKALPEGHKFYPVIYSKHRPKINIFSDRDCANKIAAQYKNEEWRYEDEWRIVISPTPELGFSSEIDVPEGLIAGVVLGAFIIKEDKERVFDWVRQIEPAIKVYEAFIDDDDYRVSRKSIDL